MKNTADKPLFEYDFFRRQPGMKLIIKKLKVIIVRCDQTIVCVEDRINSEEH